MVFNEQQEAIQNAHLDYMLAAGQHQGAQELHDALMAAGLLKAEAYGRSMKLQQDLYKVRLDAWEALSKVRA